MRHGNLADGAVLHQQLAGLLPDLRAFARFLVRDWVGADDLVQDAVVRALMAIAQFQPGTRLRAWLSTILRNSFYEQARRRRREQSALRQRFGEDEAGGRVGRERADEQVEQKCEDSQTTHESIVSCSSQFSVLGFQFLTLGAPN